MLIPFVFVALAFLSEHPMAAGAVVKAMGLCLVVGICASAVAGGAVTGIIAGVGAGGIVALRADEPHSWRARALGVAIAASYTFILARTASAIVLLPAPIFPFTAIGVADHFSERRWERDARLHDRLDDRRPIRRVRRRRVNTSSLDPTPRCRGSTTSAASATSALISNTAGGYSFYRGRAAPPAHPLPLQQRSARQRRPPPLLARPRQWRVVATDDERISLPWPRLHRHRVAAARHLR